MTNKVTVFDFETLKKLNNKAVRHGLNRSLVNKFFEVVDPTNLFPVVFSMVHNDDHVRAEFIYNAAGETAWIDVSFDDFNKLPKVEVTGEA